MITVYFLSDTPFTGLTSGGVLTAKPKAITDYFHHLEKTGHK
jgi:hypothetical protein